MYDSSFFYENLKVPTVAMGERQRGLCLAAPNPPHGVGVRGAAGAETRGGSPSTGLRGDLREAQRVGAEGRPHEAQAGSSR